MCRGDGQPPGHGIVGQSLGQQQRHRPLGRGQALSVGRPVPGLARAATDAQGPQLWLGMRPLMWCLMFQRGFRLTSAA